MIQYTYSEDYLDMELNELMEGLAAACGVKGVMPDAGGAYHLAIDEMNVSFMSIAESGQLVIWGEVAEPPPEGRELLYQVLMESMFMGRATGGAAFSIDAGSGKIFLQRMEALSALDVELFTKMLEKFVNVLEEWRKIVADFRPAAQEMARKAADDAAADRQGGMGMNGFMQV